jgi:hypothetical protein
VTEHASEIFDSIEEFLSGIPGGSVPDRVLATVLFTDIVHSTDRAASMRPAVKGSTRDSR